MVDETGNVISGTEIIGFFIALKFRPSHTEPKTVVSSAHKFTRGLV